MPHDPSQPSHVGENMGPGVIGQDVLEGALKVVEECAEVSQEIVKYVVFPSGEIPDLDPRRLDERAASEVGDLLGALDFFLDRNPQIDREVVRRQRQEKYERFVRWSGEARA